MSGSLPFILGSLPSAAASGSSGISTLTSLPTLALMFQLFVKRFVGCVKRCGVCVITPRKNMVSEELNPDHPTTKGLHDQWHKLLLVVMWKYRHVIGDHVIITSKDFEDLVASDVAAVVANDRSDGLHLYYVNKEQAEALASEHSS